MFRRLRSLAGLIASAAGIALLALTVAALPAVAAQGDIWTQPAGTPEETSGHSQEVHLPCGNVDIWADQLESHSGSWVLYHLPPPNPDPPHSYVSEGTYSYSGEGSEVIATIPMSDFNKASGPHFKVEIDNDNNKSKTFWVDCKVSIATTPDPKAASLGDTLKDTAALRNGFSPTGTITFSLYDPANAVAHVETVAVNGNGVYSTPAGHVASSAGTWHWQAAYSGDGGNDPVTSSLADEPVVVSKASPTISTEPSPSSANVGTRLKDSATLAGGFNPTGSITFTLYDPANTPMDTETVTVSGNGDYTTPSGFVANTVGTWHWKAEYSGDANNNAVASAVADEPVTVTAGEHQQVQPTIATVPNPKTAVVGTRLNDTATLSGGDNPTGSIVFTLYNPSGTAVYTESVTVSGNDTYSTSTGYVAAIQGTWHWKAAYSGDGNNLPVTSDPADEPVVVGPAGGVLAQTGYTSAVQGLSAGLLLFGLMAIAGALAWRRRGA